MKFKVGDKARVIKEGTHCQKIGAIVEIVEITEDGKYYADCPYQGSWYFCEDELEVISKKPTRQELLDMPVGTKIYTDAEDKDFQVWIKTLDNLFTSMYNDEIDESEINNDLTLDVHDDDYGTKIIKIEKPTYETCYDYSTEAQEMTVAEIEKALGHAVKIIKEDK